VGIAASPAATWPKTPVGADRGSESYYEDSLHLQFLLSPETRFLWKQSIAEVQLALAHNIGKRLPIGMAYWRAIGLQPHRVENLKFSKDPQFVEKVRDIVGLYLNPPDRAIVLCVDEKSQVQALNRTQPILPLAPGVPVERL
jgi:hypothetical protein